MTRTAGACDTYLAQYSQFEEALPRSWPRWLNRIRRRALERFRQLGFPTARRGNEPWKYTDVRPLAEARFHYPLEGIRSVTLAQLRRSGPWDSRWDRMVFINGRYSPALSRVGSGRARATSLAEALVSDGAVVQQHLARYASIEEEGFPALNTAFLRDGAFVHLPEGVSLASPLHLVFVTGASDRPTVTYPRTLVVAGRHSRLTIIESYLSLAREPHFTDAVTEIVLDEGAQVEHHRLLLERPDAFHVGVTRVWQGRDSTFTSVFFGRGMAMARNDLRVILDAPGGACYLRGLYVTAESQHIDNYINIDHVKPHTTSRLCYRGILDGSSHAVFGGTVLVRPGAVKTDAHQEDKNLILSQEAEVDSKPSLEIYADDVRCGHGATAGTVAEDALFYMASRGLDQDTAMAFLIQGFAGEVTDFIRLGRLREFVQGTALASLPRFRFASRF